VSAAQWDLELHKRNPELLGGCVKAVCAFLNGEGGILLIGIANSGEPTGLEDDIRDFKDRNTIGGFESRFRDALVRSAALMSSAHRILLSVAMKKSPVVAMSRSPFLAS
jgi:predicted HTH transcriptional regulator